MGVCGWVLRGQDAEGRTRVGGKLSWVKGDKRVQGLGGDGIRVNTLVSRWIGQRPRGGSSFRAYYCNT